MNENDIFLPSSTHDEFVHAIFTGNDDRVNLLLDEGYDIHTTDQTTSNIVHRAAFNGNVSVMEKFLRLGIHVNEVDFQGRTALHLAVHNNHLQGVKLLLEHGANPLIADNNKFLPRYLLLELPDTITNVRRDRDEIEHLLLEAEKSSR